MYPINIIVPAIRQRAAWASTLITHKHSRERKKTLENIVGTPFVFDLVHAIHTGCIPRPLSYTSIFLLKVGLWVRYSGDPLLRNVNLASRLKVLLRVPITRKTFATFLIWWFLFFSAQIEPFPAFLVFYSTYRENHLTLTLYRSVATDENCSLNFPCSSFFSLSLKNGVNIWAFVRKTCVICVAALQLVITWCQCEINGRR